MTENNTFTLYLPLETVTGLTASEYVLRAKAEKTFWNQVTRTIDMDVIQQGSMTGMPGKHEATDVVRATKFWDSLFKILPDAPVAEDISIRLEQTDSTIPPSSVTAVARAIVGALAQEKQTPRAFDMLYGTALVSGQRKLRVPNGTRVSPVAVYEQYAYGLVQGIMATDEGASQTSDNARISRMERAANALVKKLTTNADNLLAAEKKSSAEHVELTAKLQSDHEDLSERLKEMTDKTVQDAQAAEEERRTSFENSKQAMESYLGLKHPVKLWEEKGAGHSTRCWRKETLRWRPAFPEILRIIAV